MSSVERPTSVMIVVVVIAVATMVAALAFAAWLDWRARRKPRDVTKRKPLKGTQKPRQRRRK